MAITTGLRRLKFAVDQAKDGIDVSNENFTVNDARHSSDREEALSTILIVWQLYVVDDVCESTFE